MSVETITQTQKEQANGKAHGLTRNALGWINRIINESVQEISDFSALLSAQSAVQATDSRAASAQENPSKQENASSQEKPYNKETAVLPQVEKSLVQTPADKEIHLPDRAKAVGLRDGHEDKSVSAEKSVDAAPSDSDLIIKEDPEVEAAPAVEAGSVVIEEEVADETLVEQAQTVNTLAAELLASQLQTQQSQSVDPSDQVEKIALAAVAETDSQPAAVKEVLVQSTPQAMPASIEKGLVDFAQKAVQKQETAAVAAQSVVPENPANISAKNTEVVSQKAQESQTAEIGFEVSHQPTQEQTVGFFVPPKATQSSAPSLSQAVSLWTAKQSQNGLNAQEESSRPVIEALSGPKVASILNKSGSETATSSLLQAGKGMEGKANSIDLSISASLGANGAEAAGKADTQKSLKPLSRAQSLATLEKVEAALQKAAESKDGTLISLRLDPPSLGSVKVDVSFRDGLLHARLSADSAQVMQLLRERAPELQVVLRKLGLDVDRVSVSVNSGDSGTFQSDSEGKRSGTGQKSGNNFSELADFASSAESLKLDHWIA